MSDQLLYTDLKLPELADGRSDADYFRALVAQLECLASENELRSNETMSAARNAAETISAFAGGALDELAFLRRVRRHLPGSFHADWRDAQSQLLLAYYRRHAAAVGFRVSAAFFVDGALDLSRLAKLVQGRRP